jgi:hypothetical protein
LASGQNPQKMKSVKNENQIVRIYIFCGYQNLRILS